MQQHESTDILLSKRSQAEKSTYFVSPLYILVLCASVLSFSEKKTPFLCHKPVLFISALVFLTEVAEELGRAASSSSVVPYLPRLPILPSKTRTLKKQVENKENIDGTQDAVENSASSSAPGMGP